MRKLEIAKLGRFSFVLDVSIIPYMEVWGEKLEIRTVFKIDIPSQCRVTKSEAFMVS